MSFINKLVLDTLKPLQVPVSFQKYTGGEATYITFHEYLQSGEDFEDEYTGEKKHLDRWN